MSTTIFIEELYNTYLKQIGISLTNIELEIQNSKYLGAKFRLNNRTIRFRKAKQTPTKAGLFVVAWEKDSNNTNQAYNYKDAPDFLMIHCETGDCKGVFIFPKDILLEKGILASETQKGKMGFRVYLPSETALNKQATQSQRWQQEYYLDINKIGYVNDIL